MTIPTSSLYPDALDTDENLYQVHDSLRLNLSEIYNPGDTTIYVASNPTIMERFPSSGLITLTDQISDIAQRAISFFYSSKTDTSFSGLEILPGFTDCVKQPVVTNVTQNVMAEHHNNLKNALIAIEEFIGTKGTIDVAPMGATMMGRINFIRKLVLTPRAWFNADKTVGLVPLTTIFTNQSFRLGDGEIIFVWDFGDQASNISTISFTTTIPTDSPNIAAKDLNGGIVSKIFSNPGVYNVKLTVINQYGTDEIEFPDLIKARIQAPDEADISYLPLSTQLASSGDSTPPFDRLSTEPAGPWTIPPAIRSAVNTFLTFNIPDGEDPNNPGFSYAGELLVDGVPIDRATTFTWSMSDDLPHENNKESKASYSIGGIYDLTLRVDTLFGAFRITTYKNSIDIIEKTNLWLFTKSDSAIKGHEFGLISETFKTATKTQIISQDDNFLNGTNNETQAKTEFNRNVFFSPASTSSSGSNGDALMFWSSGGTLASQTVESVAYNGFNDMYVTPSLSITRPWNFISFNTGQYVCFLYGPDPTALPNTDFSNATMHQMDLSNFASVTATTLTPDNYTNGAEELQENLPGTYDGFGEPAAGRFSVYRTAWKNGSGYILRNSNVLDLFRILSFYKTTGTLGVPITNITKLTDMAGSVKVEGQLVPLSSGLFFFNNSGNISAYNDTSGVWETGSSNTTSFLTLQDTTVANFDDSSNTLLATGDEDSTAYLSYDYSTNSMIKFNSIDLTFTKLMSRPSGQQWSLGIY